jgi:hypothetical protein
MVWKEFTENVASNNSTFIDVKCASFQVFTAVKILVEVFWVVMPCSLVRSYPMGIGDPSPGIKRPGRGTDHLPPSGAEIKTAWSYTSAPPNMFSWRGKILPFYTTRRQNPEDINLKEKFLCST